MPGDFDPRNHEPQLAQDPLGQYRTAPAGLSAIATGQFVIAGLMVISVVLGSRLWRDGAQLSAGQWITALYPPLLFGAAGVGLTLRAGWGWWLTSTIYAFGFFSVPVSLVLWSFDKQRFQPGASLVTFLLCAFVLGYLSRRDLQRFIRFGTPDGRPSGLISWSPLAIGFLGAVASGLWVAFSRPA